MIRLAAPEDAETLAGVQVRAWWAAYAAYVDPAKFASEAERAVRWREILAAAETPTLVWDQGGRIGGFCSVGPAEEPEDPPVGEIRALYVDPPAQDAGVGSALLGAGEGTLADELGFAEAVLWVLEANAPARAFYEHKGWRRDDVRRETGWGPTVRYRRALR